jgi:hypothetical protein
MMSALPKMKFAIFMSALDYCSVTIPHDVRNECLRAFKATNFSDQATAQEFETFWNHLKKGSCELPEDLVLHIRIALKEAVLVELPSSKPSEVPTVTTVNGLFDHGIVTNELITQLKTELKAEIKAELKAEIKAEIKAEMMATWGN